MVHVLNSYFLAFITDYLANREIRADGQSSSVTEFKQGEEGMVIS